jgi:hypothetical protein
MTLHQHKHNDGDIVRVVIECTTNERAKIKMLAARKHMTISEYFLSMTNEEFVGKQKKPNKETLEAMKELDEGRGIRCESLKDFWEQMGINPNA